MGVRVGIKLRVRAQVIAEFKSASTLQRIKLGCDKTRNDFARSESNGIQRWRHAGDYL